MNTQKTIKNQRFPATASPALQLRIKTLALAAINLLVLSCLAPKAEPIDGDIASVIERGIDKGDAVFDHRAWDEIVRDHVKVDGRAFDYTGLKRQEVKLDAYLEALANVNLEILDRNEIVALFANAYNAYTVKTILNKISDDGTFQIQSIREISDVFGREEHRIGGFILSLNNIEHNILRPFFKDPRLHFAVNCASRSCPPMPRRALTGQNIDEQLESLTRSALSSSDYVKVEGDRLIVTKLMEWYGSDFVTAGYKGAETDLSSFIFKYANNDVRDWISAQDSPIDVEFMDYDWELNQNE